MRSFFNKPSWASAGHETGDSEFYRRSGQTYKDIIATKKSAREQQARASEPIPQKRRRVSSNSKDRGSEGSDTGEETVANIRTPVDGEIVQDDTTPDPTSNVPRDSVLGHETPPDPELLQNESSQLVSRAETVPSPVIDTNEGKAERLATSLSQDTKAPVEPNTSRSDRNSAIDNTVVQILITSKIPNTKPLIIHRKMSQPLKGVRLAWCIHQNLPKDLHPTVFLTWKGRRLFDVTTCRSLNINTHSAFNKDISSFGDFFGDTLDVRIHMEAVTEEAFAPAYQSSETMVGPVSTLPPFTEARDDDQETPSQIVLKCPGFDDFKVRVTSKTQVSHVVTAFCEARGISTDFEVYLAFDGDRLSPRSCLADCEIDDGDLVDVLLKKPI
ncbi:ubiquitin-2 like Rad60 SUMO-like-domain-containing protein [Aspergillus pseudoustus]|uniref:Ubiquitin-2 like Rad60 SUMO-like-domain-containing protein n=1 Tax=Aspergillus pseudoustus TaxID=1810923 RepID=A0ABR4INI7_9EURO